MCTQIKITFTVIINIQIILTTDIIYCRFNIIPTPILIIVELNCKVAALSIEARTTFSIIPNRNIIITQCIDNFTFNFTPISHNTLILYVTTFLQPPFCIHYPSVYQPLSHPIFSKAVLHRYSPARQPNVATQQLHHIHAKHHRQFINHFLSFTPTIVILLIVEIELCIVIDFVYLSANKIIIFLFCKLFVNLCRHTVLAISYSALISMPTRS